MEEKYKVFTQETYRNRRRETDNGGHIEPILGIIVWKRIECINLFSRRKVASLMSLNHPSRQGLDYESEKNINTEGEYGEREKRMGWLHSVRLFAKIY